MLVRGRSDKKVVEEGGSVDVEGALVLVLA